MGIRASQLKTDQSSSADANVTHDLKSANGLTQDFVSSDIDAANVDAIADSSAAGKDAQLCKASNNERYSTLQRQATQIQSLAQRLRRSASVRTKSFRGLLPLLYRRKASTDEQKPDKMAEAEVAQSQAQETEPQISESQEAQQVDQPKTNELDTAQEVVASPVETSPVAEPIVEEQQADVVAASNEGSTLETQQQAFEVKSEAPEASEVQPEQAAVTQPEPEAPQQTQPEQTQDPVAPSAEVVSQNDEAPKATEQEEAPACCPINKEQAPEAVAAEPALDEPKPEPAVQESAPQVEVLQETSDQQSPEHQEDTTTSEQASEPEVVANEVAQAVEHQDEACPIAPQPVEAAVAEAAKEETCEVSKKEDEQEVVASSKLENAEVKNAEASQEQQVKSEESGQAEQAEVVPESSEPAAKQKEEVSSNVPEAALVSVDDGQLVEATSEVAEQNAVSELVDSNQNEVSGESQVAAGQQKHQPAPVGQEDSVTAEVIAEQHQQQAVDASPLEAVPTSF